VSQWAELRHMHFSQGVSKKEIARRLGLDVKTVRRALESETGPPKAHGLGGRKSKLEPWRERIEGWLRSDRRLSAQRVGGLLEQEGAGHLSERTVRQYVSRLRRSLIAKEAFVHRTHDPGTTMEVDFGESWVVVGDRRHKVKYLVATLPASNAYFAKAYRVERLECLLDGLSAAFRFFGGLPLRVVLDNTSLAVKEVLTGRDRTETEGFAGFRGAWPFAAEYCAPRKGWEKGSVEGGVQFVRDNFFRPMAQVSSWEELNACLERGLFADMDRRRLEDGRSVREAFEQERQRLRPLPAHPPEACRVLPRVADKFGHVRVDRVHYSVPIIHAWQAVVAKVFADQVVIAKGEEVVARHGRSFEEGAKVLEVAHVLPLLERKHRAVGEATALKLWRVPPSLEKVREELRRHTRRPDREWVQILRLMERHSQENLERCAAQALERGSPRLETIEMLLRSGGSGEPIPLERLALERSDLAALDVAPAILANYDDLYERSSDDKDIERTTALVG
jgi:transposase